MSFSRIAAGLCRYHLFVWSNLNFLHISQWITLPTQSCLVLYSFCANLLHSLIMRLIVSSLLPHSPHLLFFCVIIIIIIIIILVGVIGVIVVGTMILVIPSCRLAKSHIKRLGHCYKREISKEK